MDDHTYATTVVWEGSTGAGYRGYPRAHRATAPPAATELTLSADPAFRGDANLLNPEQLLVLAASSCQLLSFLALAARHRLDVVHYEDHARALMPGDSAPMRITEITLVPTIRVVTGTDHGAVLALVEQAHSECYVANSLLTTVRVQASVLDS